MLVPDPKKIPIEDGNLVSVEQENLYAVGKELQHFRACKEIIVVRVTLLNFLRPQKQK